jgi:hypothetical protein
VLILMRWREGKPGGGKGALLSENKSLTLGTGNDQVLFETIGFSHTQTDAQPSITVFPTLRGNGAGMAVGESANAYSIREDAQANTFSATPIETSRALQAQQPSVQSHHAQTFIVEDVPPAVVSTEEKKLEPSAYDELNDSISPVHHTLRAGTKQSTGVFATIVRRLTPIECERLQGFPDSWTANRIDVKNGGVIEQKDSARYKQMGNAVAVPVVQWLLNRIIDQLT